MVSFASGSCRNRRRSGGNFDISSLVDILGSRLTSLGRYKEVHRSLLQERCNRSKQPFQRFEIKFRVLLHPHRRVPVHQFKLIDQYRLGAKHLPAYFGHKRSESSMRLNILTVRQTGACQERGRLRSLSSGEIIPPDSPGNCLFNQCSRAKAQECCSESLCTELPQELTTDQALLSPQTDVVHSKPL